MYQDEVKGYLPDNWLLTHVSEVETICVHDGNWWQLLGKQKKKKAPLWEKVRYKLSSQRSGSLLHSRF